MIFREITVDANLEVAFQNMPIVRSIRKHLEKQVNRLESKFTFIESCRVAFDIPPQAVPLQNLYDLEITVAFPGAKITVIRSPRGEGTGWNLFRIIREAFDEIELKLKSSEHGIVRPIQGWGVLRHDQAV